MDDWHDGRVVKSQGQPSQQLSSLSATFVAHLGPALESKSSFSTMGRAIPEKSLKRPV